MTSMKNTFAAAIVGVVALLAASPASATTIDFSAEADTTNPVTTAPVTIGYVTLSAFTNFPSGGFDLTGGKAGVVFFDNGKGVGVKDSKNDKGNLKGAGSKEISGGGGDAFEALKFTFSSAVDPSTLSFTLNKYKCKKDNGSCTYKEDELALIVDYTSGSSDTFDETTVEALAGFPITKDFDMPVIDFSLLTLSDPSDITMVTIKALDGHFYVKDVTFGLGNAGGGGGNGTPVSEPGTLALFGLGLAGIGYIRRRRSA